MTSNPSTPQPQSEIDSLIDEDLPIAEPQKQEVERQPKLQAEEVGTTRGAHG